MSTNFFVKRRIGGVAQPPTGANNAGEMAVHFPGVAGDKTKPELYINDGGGWRTVNSAQGTGLHFGADFTPASAKPATPKENEVHVFTTSGAITDPSWAGTALNNEVVARGDMALFGNNKWHIISGGKNLQFASRAEIDAATVTDKVIAPDQLRAATLNAPTATPANDANKLIRLDATGKIAAGFLAINGLDFGAAIDASAAGTVPPTTPSAGDIHFISAKGTLDGAGWSANLGANKAVNAGDSILFDGTNWHVLEGSLDPSAYVSKAGNNAVATDMKLTWTAPAADNTVIIDGANATKSSIDNVTLDCGTY